MISQKLLNNFRSMLKGQINDVLFKISKMQTDITYLVKKTNVGTFKNYNNSIFIIFSYALIIKLNQPNIIVSDY